VKLHKQLGSILVFLKEGNKLYFKAKHLTLPIMFETKVNLRKPYNQYNNKYMSTLFRNSFTNWNVMVKCYKNA